MQVSQASCCAQDLQSRCDFFDPSPSVPIHRFPVVSSFIHQFSQSCWKWFWIFPKVNPHIHIPPFEESSTIWGICFGNVVGISWGPPAHLRVTGARIYWWGTLTNRLCPSWCAPTRWMLVGTERCALAAKKIGHICVGKGWNMLEIPSLFKGRSWTSSNYGFSSLMLQCWEYGMFQTYIYMFFPHPWRWLDSSTWPRTFGWFQFRSQQNFGTFLGPRSARCNPNVMAWVLNMDQYLPNKQFDQH
jgi:hypothetical protein